MDSGSRDPADTLAAWMAEVLQEEVCRLRLQTGFYALDGLAPLLGVLDRLKEQGRPASIVIGSNGGGTLRNDVEEFAHRLGVPRDGAQLGVVSFSGSAYFHPKVYHLERIDGTQAAFVGSANLTGSGLCLHVEAGIALDSRQDGSRELTKIAEAIDRWFSGQLPGLTIVDKIGTLDQLVAAGVLALEQPTRSFNTSAGKSGTARANPTLARLVTFAAVPRLVTQTPLQTLADPGGPGIGPAAPATVAGAGTGSSPISGPGLVAGPTARTRPTATRAGFPQYLLFKPGSTTPTVGIDALSGSALAGGVDGLIVKLNRDSARHFMGKAGTSNISLPVATMFTLRFGVGGVHQGPTTEFHLLMRYLGDGDEVRAATTTTSVKGYGYTATETGHGDIRLVVTAEARRLREALVAQRRTLPAIDDFAVLEWPTDADPSFKLSFLDPNSARFNRAKNIFRAAEGAGQLVGIGACWLPSGMSASW